MLPKVIFKKCEVDKNLDSLVWYAKPSNSENLPINFYQKMLDLFPELKDRTNNSMSYMEIYNVLAKYVKPKLEKLYRESTLDQTYQSVWDEVNDEIMKLLEKKLDTTWDREKEIICEIGIFPSLSRDIVNYSFEINYDVSNDEIIATGIHELCHMLYFKKWKELYPASNSLEYNNPHIVWYLSEAMIDPLVNTEEFKKYTSDSLEAYPYFYDKVIGWKKLIDILRENVSKYSIDEAIRRSYEIFKEYESEIKVN